MNLWLDESAGIVSLELTLLGAVLVTGVVPAMETMRDSISGGLTSIGASVQRVTEQPTDPQRVYQPTCLVTCRTQWNANVD